MRNNLITWRLLLLMALVGLAATGCIFSPDEGGDGDTGPSTADYVWPGTTAALMKNFEAAYNNMDIDAYRELLHPQFKFFFLAGEGPSDFWDKENDLRSTENLFSGDPPPNPTEGTANRGISQITVGELLESEAWEPVSASDPNFGDIPGAERAVYTVRFVLTHDAGTITVNNSQIFFAAPHEEAQTDGTTKTKWEILGQQELPTQ